MNYLIFQLTVTMSTQFLHFAHLIQEWHNSKLLSSFQESTFNV